jgi:hypothetical protein
MDTPTITPAITATKADPSLQATTTHEEDLHSASQRRVNLIWEYTQSYIAIAVVTGALIGAFYYSTDVPALLANAFFLIVGFYFGRTNHQTVGGVQLGR